jgi:A/G-specific adenine glycosylase
MTISAFQKKIYAYYKKEKRSLPWRRTRDPYKILVSEVMLQQTQASRVTEKYTQFLKRFPTVKELAGSETREVLKVWQGLGYNRRALMLLHTAKIVVSYYKGIFPKTYEGLMTLPGIGPYTGSAIMTFAYNKPQVMIETNIRAVFIHFFFPHTKKVSDKKLIVFIEKYGDYKNPREWYNALMDYGAMLKRTEINPSRKSAHHVVQSKFKGSQRQVRGAIVRLYTENEGITKRTIIKRLPYKKDIIENQYAKLRIEGFFK